MPDKTPAPAPAAQTPAKQDTANIAGESASRQNKLMILGVLAGMATGTLGSKLLMDTNDLPTLAGGATIGGIAGGAVGSIAGSEIGGQTQFNAAYKKIKDAAGVPGSWYGSLAPKLKNSPRMGAMAVGGAWTLGPGLSAGAKAKNKLVNWLVRPVANTFKIDPVTSKPVVEMGRLQNSPRIRSFTEATLGQSQLNSALDAKMDPRLFSGKNPFVGNMSKNKNIAAAIAAIALNSVMQVKSDARERQYAAELAREETLGKGEGAGKIN